jgi:hypothetical protein
MLALIHAHPFLASIGLTPATIIAVPTFAMLAMRIGLFDFPFWRMASRPTTHLILLAGFITIWGCWGALYLVFWGLDAIGSHAHQTSAL